MAFSLTFKLPNNVEKTINIVKVSSTWNIAQESFFYPSSETFKQYDDSNEIIKELGVIPPDTGKRDEIWYINGAAFNAEIRSKDDKGIFYVKLNYRDVEVNLYSSPEEWDNEAQNNPTIYLNAGSYIVYDYGNKEYYPITGYEAFLTVNVSEIGYINLFYPKKLKRLFSSGTRPTIKGHVNNIPLYNFVPNVFYMSNPTNMLMGNDSTNGVIRTAQARSNNMFSSIIKSINDRAKNDPTITPIEPPVYPDDPDDPESPDYDPTNPAPGDQDTTSDPIGIPTKPTIDVTNTGFVTLYNPSALDIRNLAYFMWSGEFVDLIKKMFSAPFDCLIGLKLIYAPITTGASQTIWLGNVESDVSAPKITDQFTDFDCGTLTIDEYFGSFLDYSPYTKVTIFLPFIGYKQLNVDEVMNSQIHLTYRIDAYSGACIAFIHVTKTIGSTTLSSVIYEFDGNCAMDIPFTSGDMSRYVSAILGTAASTAGAVISMGAGAKLATQSIPITANDPWTKNDFSNKQTVTGLSDLGNGSAELVGGKPQIQRGGSLAGANASMALKQPYIIIERPMQQMPADYANFIGIPLNMTKTLSQVTGFTVVSQIFMASSQATDEELNMIDSLLRQGVII